MAAYIKLFCDYDETFDEMSDAEAGRLIKALLHYGASGEMRTLSGGERLVFGIIKRQIDRENGSAEAHREAGKYGGRPKTKENQSEPNETKPNQTEPKSPEKEKDKDKEEDKDKDEKRARAKAKLEMFERFWAVYPKKVGKQDAVKAWGKLTVDEALMGVILAAVEKQKTSAQWQRDDGEFIPHPATWLNGRRWEDEVAKARPKVEQTDYEQREYEERKPGELPQWLREEMEQMSDEERKAAMM